MDWGGGEGCEGRESTYDWLELIVVPFPFFFLFFFFTRETCLPCIHELCLLCDSCIRFLTFRFGLNVLPRGKINVIQRGGM